MTHRRGTHDSTPPARTIPRPAPHWHPSGVVSKDSRQKHWLTLVAAVPLVAEFSGQRRHAVALFALGKGLYESRPHAISRPAVHQ